MGNKCRSVKIKKKKREAKKTWEGKEFEKKSEIKQRIPLMNAPEAEARDWG